MDEQRAARVRHETDPDEAGDERRLVRGDPHVARVREREAGPGRRAVDGGEHGLLEKPDRLDVGVVRLLEAVSDPSRKLLELLEILPGAEASPRTGDDDRTHLRLGRLDERCGERVVEFLVERVVDVRPVERDREYRPVAFGQHLRHEGERTAPDQPPARESGYDVLTVSARGRSQADRCRSRDGSGRSWC